MEFFVCSCPHLADVILDFGRMAGAANATLQCNEGYHHFSLVCRVGKTGAYKCSNQSIEVTETDPISPLEVVFQCGR